MDPRLLDAYNEELGYLRRAAAEFGLENEVVAKRLGLDAPDVPDPYVERLLEGVAFLSARVNLKLKDEFPEFTQHLLQAIQPNYLSPTPAMCVVELEPKDGDPALVAGVEIERGAEITSAVDGHDTPVRFLTGQAVHLLAVEIAEVEYLPSRAAVAPYVGGMDSAANTPVEAGLRIRFRATGRAQLCDLAAKPLPIFLSGPQALPGELFRQLIGDACATVAYPNPGDGGRLTLENPEPFGFEDEHALLPHGQRSFRGYRLLAEYFACPERFLFVLIPDLSRAFARSKEICDVVVLFKRLSPALIGALTPGNIKLFATPAINLFPMSLGRTSISPYEHEHLITPDRTHPQDYEIFQITRVTAFERSGPGKLVAPIYELGALLYDWKEAIFYATRLRLRRASSRERRARGRMGGYVGTQTFISLTCPESPSRAADVREVAVEALVTNRELAGLIGSRSTDGPMSLAGRSVESVRTLVRPTKPRPPLGLGESAWRVIGHLTPNYSSLLEPLDGRPALLQDHLALYFRPDEPASRRQVDSLLAISSESVTRRVRNPRRVDGGAGERGFGLAVARGKRVRITLDDQSFENGRMFLFAYVIDRFLSEFVSVNSFIETEFESAKEGVFAQWPLQTGRRRTI